MITKPVSMAFPSSPLQSVSATIIALAFSIALAPVGCGGGSADVKATNSPLASETPGAKTAPERSRRQPSATLPESIVYCNRQYCGCGADCDGSGESKNACQAQCDYQYRTCCNGAEGDVNPRGFCVLRDDQPSAPPVDQQPVPHPTAPPSPLLVEKCNENMENCSLACFSHFGPGPGETQTLCDSQCTQRLQGCCEGAAGKMSGNGRECWIQQAQSSETLAGSRQSMTCSAECDECARGCRGGDSTRCVNSCDTALSRCCQALGTSAWMTPSYCGGCN